MFRSVVRAVRPLPGRSPFTRLSSTKASSPSQRGLGNYGWAAGAVAVVGSGVYFSKGGGDDKVASTPSIPHAVSETEIPVVSPVKVLHHESAEKKLRQEVKSFAFKSQDGVNGRVDVVRISSNNPIEDEYAVAVGQGVGGAPTLFAGVYDGHAGWATSAVLRKALIPYVSSALAKLSPSANVDAAIKTAFVNLDDRILSNAESAAKSSKSPASAEVIAALAPAIAGSCALLTMYDPSTSVLRTAVAGDSRAVRGTWSQEKGQYEADALSKDQTGFNEDEVNRLDKEHPGEKDDILDPKSGRLMGIAITRAFGDNRWKWSTELLESTKTNFWGYAPRPKAKTPPYMTARPEVTTRTVAGSDFVILASDGLWDVISNDDAVACVSRWLSAKKAGKPEPGRDAKTELTVDEAGWSSWRATPEYFAIEDLDNAAVCLARNALGGTRRELFRGVLTTYSPVSRYARDDITIQVIFFKEP